MICSIPCFAVIEAEAEHIRHGSILPSQLQFLSRNIFPQVDASQLAHLGVDCGLLTFVFGDASLFISISVLVKLHNFAD